MSAVSLLIGVVLTLLAGLVAAMVLGYSQFVGTVVLLIVLSVIVGAIGLSMARPDDERWLPAVVLAGFAAKVIASGFRYWSLVVLYRGVGDATGYHAKGLNWADVWRSLEVPPLGTGTDFMPIATGLIYVPYEPTMLGGFFIYATLAFMGQLLLYAAFRRSADPNHLKWYAALIFFSPTLLYWPASIGKEALMILFIGMAAYGAARLFAEYRIRWGFLVGLGFAGAGMIRIHVAMLVAAAVFGAVLLARSPPVAQAAVRRVGIVALAGAAMAISVLFTTAEFDIDLSAGVSAETVSEELDPFLTSVEGRTDEGGSVVEGGVVRSPADVPEALLRVLFRPLPYEAHNLQALLSSFEGTLLLGLFVWRGPTIIRNLRRIRDLPYSLFSLLFVGGFVLAYSPILNLGIMARQRSQVMPFLLVLLVQLGAKRVSSARAPQAVTEPRLEEALAAS